jgi:hypothetical protein
MNDLNSAQTEQTDLCTHECCMQRRYYVEGPIEEIVVISGEVRAEARTRCRIIRNMTSEMFSLICERSHIGRDSRRYLTHTRHIAMYVCHVTLGLAMVNVAAGFGFDRSTVSYACQSVESRRDDPVYDEFVSAVERVAVSIFGPLGAGHPSRPLGAAHGKI